MRNILRPDFAQALLLPPSVEDWIPRDHPARFIREVVSQTDLEQLGIKQPEANEGGTCYAPELLMSVWLYGYFRKVRSTRTLENACKEEMAFVWLSGNHQPDHNALWRFWNTHAGALRAFFKRTVKLAMDMKLVGLVLQAIDGTKIAAACSGRQAFDKEHLQSLMERLDKQITQLESDLKTAQQQDSAMLAPAVLPAELTQATRLREKVREALEVLKKQKRQHCHPQETEAVRVRSTEGTNRFGYNAQAVVDSQAQIIVAEDLFARSNDLGLLMPMVEQTAQNTAGGAQQSAADTGYCTSRSITEAQNAGIDLLMPLPAQMLPQENKPYHCSQFRHDTQKDVVICPQGRSLSFHHERLKREHKVKVYRNSAACKACPVRRQCTKDKAGRAIDITGHEQAVERHRRRMSQPEVKEHYRKRSATVEPVFGRIKQHSGFRRFTLRGVNKVRVQWSMVCSALNLRRLYTFWRTANI